MQCIGKRVFSNNQDTTFHNYLKNKKGTEIIKQLKSNSNSNSNFNSNSNKIKFLSYDEFITLTRAFSKNANIIHTSNHLSINNKIHNLIYYEKIQNHIQKCESCQRNNENLLICNGIKNILYIYRNNFKNTVTNVFQNRLDLDRWCKRCDTSLFPVKNIKEEDEELFEEPIEKELFEEPIEKELFEEPIEKELFEEPIEEIIVEDKEENPEKEKEREKVNIITSRKRGKGNGRNPIFCTTCNKFIDICLCCHRWSRKDAINGINKNTK